MVTISDVMVVPELVVGDPSSLGADVVESRGAFRNEETLAFVVADGNGLVCSVRALVWYTSHGNGTNWMSSM